MSGETSVDQIRATVLRVIGEIAPEIDTAALRTDRPLRDQVDLDSMDLLNVLIGVNEALAVDIPERDYGHLDTIDRLVSYLGERLQD